MLARSYLSSYQISNARLGLNGTATSWLLALPSRQVQPKYVDWFSQVGNLQLRAVQIPSKTQSPAVRFCKQNKGKVEGIFCPVNRSLLHDKLQTGIDGVVNGNGALLASQNLADINFLSNPLLKHDFPNCNPWNLKLACNPCGIFLIRFCFHFSEPLHIKFYPGIRATPPKHEGVESSPLGGGGSWTFWAQGRRESDIQI